MKIRTEIAICLRDKGYWFMGTNDPGRATIYKEFCGYAPDFIYRYLPVCAKVDVCDLGNITYEAIAKKVKKDLKHLEKFEPQIVEIIEKYTKELN